MSELEFAADDSLAGFRLHRLELYNWGTFHNRVWVLPLEGRNGLLTGDIGSGKSTVVDAINTLLVPPGRVAFNRAAGGDRKERDLRSYVQGYYRSERTIEGATSRPVALRERGSHTVILAVFDNSGFNQTVTLAQVLWQKEPQGQPARFYVVADGDLSIRGEFSGFGADLATLRRRLREHPGTEPIFDTFTAYSAAFRRRFGLKSEQALMLFHQTVSMKAVGNLTEFVREHMLEPFDVESRIQALLHHFDDLNRAHEAVLRAKDQITRLSQIEEHLTRHSEVTEREENLRFCRDGLRAYFANLRSQLLEQRIRRLEGEQEKYAAKRRTQEETEAQEQSERDRLRQAIAENGGDRLDQLTTERRDAENEKTRRLRRHTEYRELATQLEIPDPRDDEQFARNRQRISDDLTALQHTEDDLQNRLTEQGVELEGLRRRHETISHEVTSLRSRRSNIDAHQIAIRRRLCEDLQLPEEDLPFAGELLQVRTGEEQWEGAIERVLRSFGLSLLVPADHYAAVSEWVDRTDLRGRLVYFRVRPEERSWEMEPDADSLVAKLDIKPDSPLRPWLQDQLRERFDYTCCESLDAFRRASRGLTRAGQIKGSPHRHEKDDRYPLNDRSRYILGWRNDAKIKVLEQHLMEIEGEMADRGAVYSEVQAAQRETQDTRQRLYRLQAITEYQEIDWAPLASRLESIDEEIRTLQATSDILQTLTDHLRAVEGRLQENRAALDATREQMARISERLEEARRRNAEDQEVVESSPHSPARLAEAIDPYRAEALGDQAITPESADNRQQDLREWLQARIDAEQKQIQRLRERITQEMQDFRRDYPAETQEVDASVEAGAEFLALLERLRDDDLPAFEERFKTLLNENTIREIANFQAQLGKESHIIEERVQAINRSLEAIEYEKDRYIRLEALRSNDPDVRTFQQELRACTTGALTGSSDNQYTESKFALVKQIIDRFRGRDGLTELDRRWTEKVTDVRFWFTFAASERWREDDSEYEHYTDSGGKSGGQKEKLAYTVLAASVAYQFGLEWGETRSRTFRFVVIDEAFGRGSDVSTRFGLRLFQQLNLQLLLVTPLQKINIIEPHVASVGFVHNEGGNNSLLRCLTVEEYRQERAARLEAAASRGLGDPAAPDGPDGPGAPEAENP